MIFLNCLTKLLFPPKCVLCGKVLESQETDLCRCCRVDSPDCSQLLKKLRFTDGALAVWHYEGNVRSSILRFKFRGKRGYARCYGRMLAMKLLQERPEGFELLTWVPTSRLRKLFRGYDQAELLANAIGEELALPPVRLLKKQRNNRPQSGITGQAQRNANVLGVYRITESALLAGKRILLVDDVITTGATMEEAARMLMTAGGKSVYCGAVAAARHR